MAVHPRLDRCSVFDIRRPDEALKIISSLSEIPRSVHYSSDGRFLAIGESSDFISVIDVAADYSQGQVIDLLGTPQGSAGGWQTHVRSCD